MIFSSFAIISLWKGLVFHLYKLYYLFNTRMLVQSLVDIGSVLLEKQMKMWKCNKAEDDNCYNNGNNDNTEKLTRALSLGVRAKMQQKWHIPSLSDLHVPPLCFWDLSISWPRPLIWCWTHEWQDWKQSQTWAHSHTSYTAVSN